MRVLIGTPIHVSKDYSMERWLQNVSQVRAQYPADFMLVDNSPGLSYVEKVKGYCKKYRIKSYKIEHLDFPPLHGSAKETDEQIHERITRSREIIRQEFLASDYDAYLFWENDLIIPTDSLGKLVDLMQAGNFMVVNHNCWIRTMPDKVNFDYGLALFNRDCLEKYSFLPEPKIDPATPDYWYEAEVQLRKRIHKDGCKYTEVTGLIEPIYHLNK